MEEKNKDVDLEEFFKSAENDPASGASATKEGSAANVSEDVKTQPSVEAISDRANARIRELVEALKSRDEIIAQLAQQKRSETGSDSSLSSDDIESFLKNVEDEPTRKLLKDYAETLKKSIFKEVAPQLSRVKEMEFERDFNAMAAKFPQLEAFREEAKKSYQANPNASVKAIVGEMILEHNLSKPKPVERGGIAAREKIDINSASKEELYELLESMKE
jgi:DNA uptake protein ComE-like DNA-binding protein